MAQNFTDAVTEALQTAFQDAEARKNTEVKENHLLEAFFKKTEDYFCSILSSLKADPDILLKR